MCSKIREEWDKWEELREEFGSFEAFEVWSRRNGAGERMEIRKVYRRWVWTRKRDIEKHKASLRRLKWVEPIEAFPRLVKRDKNE